MEGVTMTSATTDSPEVYRMALRSLLVYVEELKRMNSSGEEYEELLRDKEETIRRLNEKLSNCMIALNQAKMQLLNNQTFASISLNTAANNSDSSLQVTLPSDGRMGEYSGLGMREQRKLSTLETDCSQDLPSDVQYLPSVATLTSVESTVNSTLEKWRSVEESGAACRSEVSQDLMKKLMSQNTRLKKTMRDILELKGLTLTDYLNKQEYEDIIDQQRKELKLTKQNCEELKNIIDSGDNTTELQRLCSDQVIKISQLTKSVAVQKALAESFSQQCNKVKDELNDCKQQLRIKEQQLIEAANSNTTLMAEKHAADSNPLSGRSVVSLVPHQCTLSAAETVTSSPLLSITAVPALTASPSLITVTAGSHAVLPTSIKPLVAAIKPSVTGIKPSVAATKSSITSTKLYTTATPATSAVPSTSVRPDCASHSIRDLRLNMGTTLRSSEAVCVDGAMDPQWTSDDGIEDFYYCPRCEKRFVRKHREMWNAHTRKCVD